MCEGAFQHVLQRRHGLLAGDLQIALRPVHPGEQAGGEQVPRARETGRQARDGDTDPARHAICGRVAEMELVRRISRGQGCLSKSRGP